MILLADADLWAEPLWKGTLRQHCVALILLRFSNAFKFYPAVNIMVEYPFCYGRKQDDADQGLGFLSALIANFPGNAA